MGIKVILVHLDNSAASESRLDVAIAYASKHGALLRGLYLITHFFYEPHTQGKMTDSQKAEEMFAAKTSKAGIKTEWLFQDCSVLGSNVSDIITCHAYFSDLIVLGQVDLTSPVINIPTDLVERVILACGRPVLIVPYSGTFQTAGDRIMIAWKVGRESIRAVNDSLPHMQKAKSVVVVEVVTTNEDTDASLEAVKHFLMNHDIKIVIDLINSGSFPIGDTLLNNACEKKIDLLVMGAFTPNRRGKLEMNHVARHVLKHLTVPVLMSH